MRAGAGTEGGSRDIRACSPGDGGYPTEFVDLAERPARVWIRGTLPPPPRIAIVGARAATPYGIEHAERLAHDLGRLGFAIVSGLARGIDAAAHRGALRGEAPGVAVLAGGVDRITPRHNEALGQSVLRNGAVIAEQPPGTSPLRAMFVQRNRLVAALCRATIVVEAARRSGALSTAAAARRLGRAVLALPGDVDRPTSRGCNDLIAGGARVCQSVADVLATVAAPESSMSRLRRHVHRRPRTLAAIAQAAGLSEREALAVLLRLQWAGQVRATPGQRWVLA